MAQLTSSPRSEDKSVTPNTSASKIVKPKPKRNRKSQLSDTDRKLHHIQSEHKRRTAIREAFLKLTQIVPTLKEEDSRSEITVLNGSVEWLWGLQREFRELKTRLENAGESIKDEWCQVIVPEIESEKPGNTQDNGSKDNGESEEISGDESIS